jgi:glycosyltransferase involved in cell wall biosynthesis
VAVSATDATRIRQQFRGKRVQVVDNGVDTAYFRPSAPPAGPGRILFLGSLDWRPNLDAVAQLLDVVFPAVRAGEPTARLWLVGRNPPARLRRRAAGMPGVELHADVADVRPYLAGSHVLAVPLRVGGGSRLKILEALAAAVPVVSTRVGAEGLCLQPEHHLTVVDDVAGMAAALLPCLRRPEVARRQAECGRRVVLDRYDWGVLAERLEQVWLDCCVRR